MTLFLAERTSVVEVPLPEYPQSLRSGTDGYYLQSPVGTADVGVSHQPYIETSLSSFMNRLFSDCG